MSLILGALQKTNTRKEELIDNIRDQKLQHAIKWTKSSEKREAYFLPQIFFQR